MYTRTEWIYRICATRGCQNCNRSKEKNITLSFVQRSWLYRDLGWQTLQERRYMHKILKCYWIVKCNSPQYLNGLIYSNHQVNHKYNARGSAQGNLPVPLCQNVAYKKSYIPSVIMLWNNLSPRLRNAPTKASCKRNLVQSFQRNRHFVKDYPENMKLFWPS